MPTEIVKMFQRLLKSIARLFIPLDCPICGQPPIDDFPGMLCSDCFGQLNLITGRRCPGCGGKLYGLFDMCPECIQTEVDRPWEKAYSMFKMEGAGRELIHLCKYKNHPEILRTLAHLATLILGDELKSGHYDIIVPVPLYWFRLLQRGYNQSQILCECLGKELGIPVRNALVRKKWTKQQARLSKAERIRNLSTAFSVKDLKKVEMCAILLVDDVFTTGATLASAANVLLKAGACRIDVLTIGRR